VRLGLSSFTYTWEVGVPGWPVPEPLTASALVRRAAARGIDLVQIADNLPLHALTPAELEELVGEATDLGVDLEVGTRGTEAELLRGYARIAARVGSPFVRIVVDTAEDHPSPEEIVARLRAVEADYRDAGLVLAIENHDRFTTDQLLGILDAAGDWVAIVLDTVNSFGAQEPPAAVVPALGPRAVNLHLKDFTIRRHRHQMGFEIEGTPAGDGLLDIPGIVAGLDAAARVRSAILELWTPPADDIAATIRREQDWADRSLDYLRAVPGLERTAA
jgi:sugar phosphate isomerase/epimerase